MIFHALKILTAHLNSYYTGLTVPGGLTAHPTVNLQNVSQLTEEELKSSNKVLLTLVNLAEETTMKNEPGTYVVNSNEAHYTNPPVNLNLFLLFSVCMSNYEHALIYLSHTISFFQGKRIFTRQDGAPILAGLTDDFHTGLPGDFHIILDLYSLSFEQVNYLWSTLGGKQHPFVCYKVRLVSLQRAAVKETRGVIRKITIDDSAAR
ncbi:DUF4255 domain-containing protein [Desulfobulbus oligotrophicus]|uniref:DUF4255 domain-containing protein n=1 Tax=Desulfobulbus oligotrophicus TaxID=1909699 RepID=A0A7T5VDH8_9BACT|nr:DUF4255 domain-containing protein [Desulfobulbus oligotrophicus]QQG65878.1 DUF4255 domain-containing protein [Desulfobulbus oligotrophicus]